MSPRSDPLAPDLRVRPVRSRRDARAVLSLMRTPYVDVPAWLHPDMRILRELLRGKTELGKRAEHETFLATKDGEPVATLTVFLHRSFEETLGEKIAAIGFLEALAGEEAAVDALFAAAIAWVREHGARRIWGPMNGHLMYGFGCLDDRFDETPTLGVAYGRREYPGHWWRQGFKKAPSFYSYRMDLTSAETRAAVETAARGDRLGEITIRVADLREWRREVAIFADLHNRAFAKNWGDTPISEAETWELMGLARFTADPEMFLIGEIAGRPVGFVFCLPDLNPLLHGLDVEPSSLRAGLRILLRGRRARRAGLFAIGVLPEARGHGLAEALTARAMRRMIARGMTEMEYCLVLEDNVASQRIARRFGGAQTTTHRVFEKLL
ncbi:MAG: GNAT family N-acetyltransferase [Candidatus Binatia bacterium]